MTVKSHAAYLQKDGRVHQTITEDDDETTLSKQMEREKMPPSRKPKKPGQFKNNAMNDDEENILMKQKLKEERSKIREPLLPRQTKRIAQGSQEESQIFALYPSILSLEKAPWPLVIVAFVTSWPSLSPPFLPLPRSGNNNQREMIT
ncbi:IQ domain-containing protein F3 isoform X7 [Macaca nemestrina]|uniref:IQ domain-containing protein F3 isoform X7 n=1 Tax=Macaca nemestrina TaxID=9545 RepID=UPI0039B900DA